MKRAYYYFLFCIFWFYKNKFKYDDFVALWYVVTVSTTVLFINLFSIYTLAVYMDIIPMFNSKYWILLIMLVLGIYNYYYFIRKKKFLDYSFRMDTKGGWQVIIYMIITAILFVLIANANREKIYAERKAKHPTEQPVKQNSLEGKIRDWWNNRDK